MSESLRNRLERGESVTARGLSVDPPVDAVVARVRRRREARTVMVAAVSVAVLAAGAGIATGFLGRADEPAMITPPSPVTSPSPSFTPTSRAGRWREAW